MGNWPDRPGEPEEGPDLYVCLEPKHAAAGEETLELWTPPRPRQDEYCADSHRGTWQIPGDNDAARLFLCGSALIHIRALTFFWIVNSFTYPYPVQIAARVLVS